jgi:hypothetical protein
VSAVLVQKLYNFEITVAATLVIFVIIRFFYGATLKTMPIAKSRAIWMN